jgi:predicted nucleic acid-binding protein
MRVFLDANMLFSGAYSDRNHVLALMAFTKNTPCQWISCDLAVTEAVRNIERKSPLRSHHLQQLLAKLRIVDTVFQMPIPIDIRDKDIPIIASAQFHQCDILLTGDKRDFGQWMNRPQDTGGVRVMMVAELLAEWAGV